MKQFPGSLEFRRLKRGKKESDHNVQSEKKIHLDKSNIVKNMDYGRLMSFSTFFMVKNLNPNQKIYSLEMFEKLLVC